MTSPVLSDYGLQYGYTGTLLNGSPLGDGSIIDVTQVDGLDSAPAKTSEASYEGRDGGILNAFNEGMRKVTITGMLYAGAGGSVFPLIDVLKANYAIGQTPQPLFFQQEGTTQRQVFCKSLGFNYSWTSAMRTGTTPFTISLQAEDPTIYGTQQYAPVGFCQTPNSVPGYNWSRAWSYTWGGAAMIGLTQLTNNGNKYTGFLATIQGQACQNPQIICDSQNGLNVDTSLVIGSTDTLVFDFYNQSLYLNGVSKHALVTNEGWFKLQPGVNVVRFLADSNTPAMITYTFYDGWR